MGSNQNTEMCIPYTVRETPDKGRGVFADAAIPKGSTVWRHVAGQYSVYDERSLLKHTRPEYDQVLTATSTKYVSNALLVNHFTLVAARDIEEGEELTLDYNDDPDGPQYYDTLCEQYGVTWDWL